MSFYKNINTKEKYKKLLKSGMFWEFHPELSGCWIKDVLLIKLSNEKIQKSKV